MLHCFCGLGSGVSKLLRDKVPFLVSNHCICSPAGLACGQAADEISYLKICLTSYIAFTSISGIAMGCLGGSSTPFLKKKKKID